jgi:hypothetical protein
MIAWAHPNPIYLVGEPAADLARCREPWQILRRDSRRYTVELTGPAAMAFVTIDDDLVVRVDPVQSWPPPTRDG